MMLVLRSAESLQVGNPLNRYWLSSEARPTPYAYVTDLKDIWNSSAYYHDGRHWRSWFDGEIVRPPKEWKYGWGHRPEYQALNDRFEYDRVKCVYMLKEELREEWASKYPSPLRDAKVASCFMRSLVRLMRYVRYPFG